MRAQALNHTVSSWREPDDMMVELYCHLVVAMNIQITWNQNVKILEFLCDSLTPHVFIRVRVRPGSGGLGQVRES